MLPQESSLALAASDPPLLPPCSSSQLLETLFKFYVPCPVATHVAAMSMQTCRWRTFVKPRSGPALPAAFYPSPEMYSGDRDKLLASSGATNPFADVLAYSRPRPDPCPAIPDSCPTPLRSLS